MTVQLSELGQAALDYVNAGFGVFPLHAGKKTPMTKHGHKDWTDDPESVRSVWGKYPNANIGIACGSPSGNLVVIDVDKDDGYDGADTLAEWEAEHGKLPETACAVTGRGGVHYYYRSDGRDLHPDSNPDMHIDVRAEGGFVMAAPSVHPNGSAMYWDLHYEDYPIADADDTVYALIDAIYDHGGKGGAFEKVDASEGFKKGGRNKTLYKMACGLMSQSWDDDAIIASIETYNAMAKDPLPKHEVDKLLKSALSLPKGKSEEWYKGRIDEVEGGEQPRRGRPRKFDHSAIGDALMDECGACFVDGMPAIRSGEVFSVGWNAVDAEIIKRVKDAKRSDQNEVHHYLTVLADRKRQSPPNLIAFSNGVLDVDTMKLRDWEPEDVIPNIIPHEWNEDAECPEVDEILLKMSACDADVYQNLMEVMGCCMYRSAEFGQSAILLGGGSNGKSTYIQMLLAMLGEQNVSSLDMGMIGKQFHTGRLVGKLANLGDDISNEFQHGDILSIFKKVVTGNRLYADVKGTEGFEFTPYCQMVFSANEFPRLADYTDGMMRRIFPIEFNAVFRRTDPDYNPRIVHKVTTERACERMCVLAVGALRNVIAQNGFSPNKASERRVEEIKADNDTVLAWAIDDCRDAENLTGCVIMACYETYRDWCTNNGLQAVKRTKFTRSLTNRFGLESKVVKREGRAVRCFVIA